MHYRREMKSAVVALLFAIGLVIAQKSDSKTDSRTEPREPALIKAPADWAQRQNPYDG